jgi:hypothetical protein
LGSARQSAQAHSEVAGDVFEDAILSGDKQNTMQPGDQNGFDEGILHQRLMVTGDLPEPGQRPLNRPSPHHSRAEETIAYRTMMK